MEMAWVDTAGKCHGRGFVAFGMCSEDVAILTLRSLAVP
jgi:hypothetical protein